MEQLREKNLSFPVVPVPLWEPLQSCPGWSPASPAWPEYVNWLEMLVSVLIAGISVPSEGQDTSPCGLKGTPFLGRTQFLEQDSDSSQEEKLTDLGTPLKKKKSFQSHHPAGDFLPGLKKTLSRNYIYV